MGEHWYAMGWMVWRVPVHMLYMPGPASGAVETVSMCFPRSLLSFATRHSSKGQVDTACRLICRQSSQ